MNKELQYQRVLPTAYCVGFFPFRPSAMLKISYITMIK